MSVCIGCGARGVKQACSKCIAWLEGRPYNHAIGGSTRGGEVLRLREAGDTLSEIAARFGVTSSAIAMAEGKSLRQIRDVLGRRQDIERVNVGDDMRVLGLSVRAENCLRNEGCVTVADVLTELLDEPNLLRVPNFGRKSLAEIRQILAEENIPLPRPEDCRPMSPIRAVKEAAELAFSRTVKVGVVERHIEVVAVMWGWQVRGRVAVGPSYRHREERIEWSAFTKRPETLIRAVRSIDEALLGIEAKEAAEDRAEGAGLAHRSD